MKNEIAKALLTGLKNEEDDELDAHFMERASKIQKEDMLLDPNDDSDEDEEMGKQDKKSLVGMSMLNVKPSPFKYRVKSISHTKALTNHQLEWLQKIRNNGRFGYGPMGGCPINVADKLIDQGLLRQEMENVRGKQRIYLYVTSAGEDFLSGNSHKHLPGYGKKDGVAPTAPPKAPANPNEPGFTGKIKDSIGRNRCYKDGVPVHCNTIGEQEDGGETQQQEGQQGQQQQRQQEQGEYIEGNREHASAPQGEQLTKAPCCLYTPDPTQDNPETGYPESRIGVPAMSVPPPPKEIPRLPNLTERERKAEGDFADAFLANPDGMVSAYMKGKNQVVGQDDHGNPKYAIGDAPNIFNTDDAKLLSSDYNPQGVEQDAVKNGRGVFNLAVHQTANAIAKKAFVNYLDSDEFKKLPDDKKFVLVTSGGVAAGKGYALGKSPETAALQGMAGAVWDAAGEQNAAENPWILAECRKRGIKAKFAFIHANPIETWENPKRGVVQRANNIGRMVDARVFADSYSLGAKNFKKFMDENIEAEDANFYIINNATGGEPQMVSEFPEESLSVDGEALYERASRVLQERAEQLRPAVVRGGSLGQRVWGKSKASGKSLLFKRTKVLQGHIRMKAMSKEDDIAKALMMNIHYNNENYEKVDADQFERSLLVKPVVKGKKTEQPQKEESGNAGKEKERMPKIDAKKSPFKGKS